ncbi:MAG: MSHA biogenesis protein MshM [Pseudohongiellaceae bacterium]|jgi:MSHA biogenesis protein MshM
MSKHAFYFSEGPYLRSMQSLHYALMNSETFIQFMGVPGSGKTTLCDKLALYMERKGHEVFFIDKQLDSPEMVRSVLANKFNLPSSNNFARLMEDCLAQAEEKTRVLIFDDAHLLSDITLIEIHRLSEIQVNSKRLLNIVVCGEPRLEKRLGSTTEFKSLALSVSHKFLLEPMSSEEVGQFVANNLDHEGIPNTPISTAALALLYRTTKGFPRPAALVAQLIADARRGSFVVQELGKEELAGLIKASNIQAALPASQLFEPGQLKVIAPVAAVFAIAVLGFLFQLTMDDSESPAAEIAVVASVNALPAMTESRESPFAREVVQPEVTNSDSEPAAQGETVLNSSVAVTAIPDPQPVIPSLLRPAPTFSLDEEPASDSNLALVTAAEIGVTGELLQVPEFAELVAIEAEKTADAAAAEMPGSQPNVTSSLESESVREAAAQASAVESFTASTENSTSSIAMVDPVPEQAVTLEPSNSEVSARAVVAEPAVSSEVANSAEPVVVMDSYREAIDGWLEAWADQDMDGYFASYAENFEPRYDESANRWRRSRTRVITRADSINLNLSEFSVVSKNDATVEVNFWLDYESPTYSDSTLKKLVLSNSSGRWLILEEVNLQVRS